jgi:hypothetical protein
MLLGECWNEYILSSELMTARFLLRGDLEDREQESSQSCGGQQLVRLTKARERVSDGGIEGFMNGNGNGEMEMEMAGGPRKRSG